MNKTFFIAILFLLPVFLVGCSDHVHISGRVTYSDDGTPLEAGTVIFETSTFHARGEIGQDGRYTLATHRPGDGLPPGMYRVYVATAFRYETPPGSERSIEIPLIAPQFTEAATSGLEVNVDRNTRTFDFQVDRAP